MSIIYHDTNVLKFLKVAELWGDELNTDMWTVARKMAEGTNGYKIEANPLIIHDSSTSSWLSSTFNMSKITWWVLGIFGAIIAGTLIPHCTKSPQQGQMSDATSSFQDRLSFIEAAKQGNISVIESLLNKGIDINTIDQDGNTALIESTWYNQRACVQKLIEKGSKVNMKRRWLDRINCCFSKWLQNYSRVINKKWC